MGYDVTCYEEDNFFGTCNCEWCGAGSTPMGFPYCDGDTAVTAQQVSLGGGLKGYTVVRTSCESNEYCGDGHCCEKGYYWSDTYNACVAGADECTEQGYNVFSIAPWYSSAYGACCSSIFMYGQYGNYFVSISVY